MYLLTDSFNMEILITLINFQKILKNNVYVWSFDFENFSFQTNYFISYFYTK